MAKSWSASDPSKFPEPPRFGVWNNYSFSIHFALSQVKSLITSQYTDYNGLLRREIRIYEHDGQRWQELYHLPKGSAKVACSLWDGVAPKTMAVSDEAVEAAIASIVKGA
jgi:hypothetical protein